MKEILIPLNFNTTPAVYDTKQSFSTSDEASGVLTFTTTADVAGTVASLTIRNASKNANRQTVRIERLDVNTSPFSYALNNPLPFGQYEGTVLLKKNLTVIASAVFLFGVNSSLSAEVLPDLVKAYSLDELVENVETEVSNLKDAFNLTVSETVKGVNKTESSLQAQENVRYLNEHQRKANELERIAAEVERKDTFDTLVDSEVIEQTVVKEVAEKYQEIEALHAPGMFSFKKQLAEIALNVKSFGAVGDGITDDGPAIREAVTFAKTLGSATVYFPTGVFLVSTLDSDKSGIDVASNIHFRGDGRESVVKIGNGLITASDFNLFGHQTRDDLIDNCKIYDLTIDMNASNNVVTPELNIAGRNMRAIYISYATNFFCDNVYFKNANGRNVVIINNWYVSQGYKLSKNIIIRNCEFHNLGAGNSGSEAQGDHSSIYVTADYCIVDNCYFHNDNASLDYGVITSNAIEIHAIKSFVKNNRIENMKIPFIIASQETNVEYALFRDNIVKNCDFVAYHLVDAGGTLGHLIFDNITGTVRTGSTNVSIFAFARNDGYNNVEEIDILNCNIKNAYSPTVAYLTSAKTHSFVQIYNTKKIKILNNNFSGCGSQGVKVLPIDGVTELEISDNEFVDVALGVTLPDLSYKSFIASVSTKKFKKILLSHNKTEKVDSASQSIYFAYIAAPATQLLIDNNFVVGYSGAVSAASTVGDHVINHSCNVVPRVDYAVACNIGSTWRDIVSGFYYKKRQNNRANTGWFIEIAGTSAPTVGSFVRGDYCVNTNPYEQGTAGSKYIVEKWICTANGSPGTWLECRTLTGG